MQPDLLANPAPTAARYDELLAGPGTPRAHWARFHAELQGTTGTALADWIEGREADDTMSGGAGGDLYLIDADAGRQRQDHRGFHRVLPVR